MLKKALWTLVFIGVAGILVFGAVNRTQARASEDGASNTVAGTGASGVEDAQGESETHLWRTRTGVVAVLDRDRLLVTMDSGESLTIEDRSWEFAQQAGFNAVPGDALQVVGFDKGDAFEVGALTNLTSQQRVQIRDAETGRPMWAGRGRQGN